MRYEEHEEKTSIMKLARIRWPDLGFRLRAEARLEALSSGGNRYCSNSES
jgi:hypothetical protein